MNRIITIIGVAFASLLFVGCTSTDPLTGQKVYDPVKTTLLTSTMQDGLAEVVYWTSKADPNTKSAWVIADDVLEGIQTQGPTERSEIERRLLEIQIPGLPESERSATVKRVGAIILGKFDALKLLIAPSGLDDKLVLGLTLTTLRTGITQGLGYLE